MNFHIASLQHLFNLGGSVFIRSLHRIWASYRISTYDGLEFYRLDHSYQAHITWPAAKGIRNNHIFGIHDPIYYTTILCCCDDAEGLLIFKVLHRKAIYFFPNSSPTSYVLIPPSLEFVYCKRRHRLVSVWCWKTREFRGLTSRGKDLAVGLRIIPSPEVEDLCVNVSIKC